MKKNSKLMLLATSLLTVSIAASATSAFAWYTASKVATVQLNKIDITTKASSLTVTIDPVQNTDFVEKNYGEESDPKTRGQIPENPFQLTNESQTYFSDVTSKGDGVYNKPKFDPTGTKIVGYYSEAQALKFTKTLYLKFEATGPSKLQLYLSSTSVPNKVGQTNDLNPADAFRYSVTKSGTPTETYPTQGVDETVQLYANPLGAAAECKYLTTSDIGAAAGLGTNITSNLIASNDKGSLFNVTDGSNEVTAFDQSTNADAAHGYLGEIAPNGGKLFLKFNLWVEGTDPQCIMASEEAFEDWVCNFKLNFYALEVAAA